MDIGIGIGIGLLLGVVITYFLLQVVLKKSQQAKIDEMNGKADLVIKEARVTASRITDEAKTKADRIVKTRRSNKRKFKKRKNGLLI